MISKLPSVIPVSDLKLNLASVLESLRHSGRPAVISEAEREILAALAKGEQEIAAGVGYDLDEVMAEADQLLARLAP